MSSRVVDPETPEAAEAARAEAEATLNPTPEPVQDDVPEKYRGKSLHDIIEMHRNAESELGRKNNEIGVVRKLADELIGVRALEQRTRENPPPPTKPLTADRLLENPEDAILDVVKREATSRTEALENRTRDLESELMVERFEKRHPGFQETMATPEFGAFVQGSNYRRKLASAAAAGDFDAADDLFGLYEEAKTSAPAAPKAEDGVAAARKATLAKSGGSSASGVVPSNDGKKIFSRTELMEMRIKRPDEFDARQEEILAAYREKRVR